jgi:hypothetical protein
MSISDAPSCRHTHTLSMMLVSSPSEGFLVYRYKRP